MEAVIISAVDPILCWAQSRLPEITGLIRALVECESPSDDRAAVNRMVELVSDVMSPMAAIKTFSGGRFGKHLVCEMKLPGRRKQGQVMVLGHSDTVWPDGTLRSMPFREAGGRLWGPGVFDMKAAIGLFVVSARALRELETPVPSKVLLQLNSDEEVGSESSRPLTEKNAARSKAVLVLEPSTGPEGKLKTARKGVGTFRISVKGKAAHSGLDFESGASAVLELARQIEHVAGFTNLKRGITVNPGVISGGTRPNVVAAEAHSDVDFRIARLMDAGPLERKFRSLRPVDKRCSIGIVGGLNRPPMERSEGVVRLFRSARKLAGELGLALEESASGGGSDGNFTAALGIPTLDGLGAVGEGAHAPDENVLVSRLADRTALIAKLLAAI